MVLISYKTIGNHYDNCPYYPDNRLGSEECFNCPHHKTGTVHYFDVDTMTAVGTVHCTHD